MPAVGVDLGGTKVLAALVDGGDVVARAKVPTPQSGVGDLIAAVAGAVRQVSDGDHRVGVGAPGIVDPGTGTVLRAPNLAGFDEPVPLAERLADTLGVPVTVDNDVNVGTLAEQHVGAVQGRRHVLGLFVGTGVGGAVVLDGRLRRGPRGMAGEIGHTVVGGERVCGCGHRGHLEAHAGRGAMEEEARRLHAAGRTTLLVEEAGDRRIRSGAWKRALEAGDEVAVELLDGAVAALGAGIASAACLLDLDAVVLGGGLVEKLGRPFARRIEGAARDLMLLPEACPGVVVGALGDDAGILGAALLAGRDG